MFTPILGDIAAIVALEPIVATLWAAVLAIGVGMVGYRVAKRVIGRF